MCQLMPRSVFCWLWQKVQITVAGIVLLKESVLWYASILFAVVLALMIIAYTNCLRRL